MMANEVKEEFPDFDLRVIDSKCASLGYGTAVRHAADLCINGNTIQEIETSVKNFCEQLEHILPLMTSHILQEAAASPKHPHLSAVC